VNQFFFVQRRHSNNMTDFPEDDWVDVHHFASPSNNKDGDALRVPSLTSIHVPATSPQPGASPVPLPQDTIVETNTKASPEPIPSLTPTNDDPRTQLEAEVARLRRLTQHQQQVMSAALSRAVHAERELASKTQMAARLSVENGHLQHRINQLSLLLHSQPNSTNTANTGAITTSPVPGEVAAMVLASDGTSTLSHPPRRVSLRQLSRQAKVALRQHKASARQLLAAQVQANVQHRSAFSARRQLRV